MPDRSRYVPSHRWRNRSRRDVVSIIGGFTAAFAGLIALTQTDLKRVLAYSTVSQLGYMFLALGTGSMLGIVGGMFHLFTHAHFQSPFVPWFWQRNARDGAYHRYASVQRTLRKIMPVTALDILIWLLGILLQFFRSPVFGARTKFWRHCER